MSKICYMVVPKKRNDSFIKEEIKKIFLSAGLGVTFDIDYFEPALKNVSGNFLICSITDNPNCDNCELFLLADNCYYSGKKNSLPFFDRMEMLAQLISKLQDSPEDMELFLGDSGTEYDDFTEILITTAEFPFVANQLFNNCGFPQLHFLFSR